jgi:hypothetical protein
VQEHIDRGFPSERDIRLMREAANIQEQLRSFDIWGDHYSVQRIQEERRREEQVLRAADAVWYLHEVEQLRRTLGVSQVDFLSTAQERVATNRRIFLGLVVPRRGGDRVGPPSWL